MHYTASSFPRRPARQQVQGRVREKCSWDFSGYNVVHLATEEGAADGTRRLWEALQVLPLWRVFVMHNGFREIINSFNDESKY